MAAIVRVRDQIPPSIERKLIRISKSAMQAEKSIARLTKAMRQLNEFDRATAKIREFERATRGVRNGSEATTASLVKMARVSAITAQAVTALGKNINTASFAAKSLAGQILLLSTRTTANKRDVEAQKQAFIGLLSTFKLLGNAQRISASGYRSGIVVITDYTSRVNVLRASLIRLSATLTGLSRTQQRGVFSLGPLTRLAAGNAERRQRSQQQLLLPAARAPARPRSPRQPLQLPGAVQAPGTGSGAGFTFRGSEQVGRFERSFLRLQGVFGEFRQRATGVDRSLAGVGKRIRGITGNAGDLTRRLTALNRVWFQFFGIPITNALLFAAIASQVVRFTDSVQNLRNQLRGLGLSNDQVSGTLDSLFDSANRARVPVGELTTTYRRFYLALQPLGVATQEIRTVTEGLAKALTFSGASTIEVTQGMRQLSQAFNKGKLDGDELRTVMETLPFVADRIAAALGTTRDELLLLGPQGRVSTTALLEGMRRVAADVENVWPKVNVTIGQAFTVLGNEIARAADSFETRFTIFSGAARLILEIADSVDVLSRALAALAPAIAFLGIVGFIALLKSLAGVMEVVVKVLAVLSSAWVLMAAALVGAVGLLREFREELSSLPLVGGIFDALNSAIDYLIKIIGDAITAMNNWIPSWAEIEASAFALEFAISNFADSALRQIERLVQGFRDIVGEISGIVRSVSGFLQELFTDRQLNLDVNYNEGDLQSIYGRGPLSPGGLGALGFPQGGGGAPVFAGASRAGGGGGGATTRSAVGEYANIAGDLIPAVGAAVGNAYVEQVTGVFGRIRNFISGRGSGASGASNLARRTSAVDPDAIRDPQSLSIRDLSAPEVLSETLRGRFTGDELINERRRRAVQLSAAERSGSIPPQTRDGNIPPQRVDEISNAILTLFDRAIDRRLLRGEPTYDEPDVPQPDYESTIPSLRTTPNLSLIHI